MFVPGGLQERIEQGVHVDLCLQAGASQEGADELAMQEDRFGRRRTQPLAKCHGHPEVPCADGESRGREIVAAAVSERFTNELDDIDDTLQHFPVVVGPCVADLDCGIPDGVAVLCDDRPADAPIYIYEFAGERTNRPEVQQSNAPLPGQIEVVGEIGIGLHESELEQFPKHQRV